MNYIQKLGTLAIATRLRGLTDLLVRDMVKIYEEQNIKFEPRWFSFLHLLNSKGKLSITEIAKELNQSHPAANQVANSLEKKGFIVSTTDKKDNKRRIIKMSHKGKTLVKDSQYIWNAVDIAVKDLIRECYPEFLDSILALEQNLSSKSIYKRINNQIKLSQLNELEIIDFDPKYKNEFRILNVEWLEKYYEIEPEDDRILSNPESEILKKGGKIIFAKHNNIVIGTATILKIDNSHCELTKMAVTEKFQGKQAGRILMNAILQEARNNKYERIILFTSPQLNKAISLYESVGFTEVTGKSDIDRKYKRYSIQMELKLNV